MNSDDLLKMGRWGRQPNTDHAPVDHLTKQWTPGSTTTHGSNNVNSNNPKDKFENEYHLEKDDEQEPYIVYQRYGYFSILFAIIQTCILVLMMWKCGMAPLQINPMVGPYPHVLSEWGGKNAVDIIDNGEWWRYITPFLLHAGVIHLLCNIGVQVDIGAFYEREWGSWTWLVIYVISDIGSSILSTIFMPNSISVGSSGAVMGLFGGKLAEVFCRQCESKRTKQQRIGHEVRQEQLGAVLCSVLVVGLFSFIPYVDWAAHLGGLVAGFSIGLALFARSIKSIIWRSLWVIVGLALTIGLLTFGLWYVYNGDIEVNEALEDVCGYYQQYFEDYECTCSRNGNNNNGGGSQD